MTVSLMDDDEERFDMRALWRLGLWALAAAVGVGLVVMAGYTEVGTQRVRLAWATVKGPIDGTRGLPPATFPADPDNEARRLAAQVRALSADRERLVARLEAVEKSLEDVTGSIGRQPAPPRPVATVPPVSALPAMAALPAVTQPPEPAAAPPKPDAITPAKPDPVAPAKLESITPAKPEAATVQPPEIGWAASATQPSRPSETPEWPLPPPSSAATPAGLSETTAAMPAPGVTRTEFGVDVGGGATVSALRALWQSIRASHPTLLDGLRPVVTIRDGARGGTELRLIAGPLVNAGSAARLCGSLTAAGLTCQPAVFDGQRLAVR